MPLATNTVVVNFEQLASNVLDTAVEVILLDTTFWGGIRSCVKLATMLHLSVVILNFSFASDAHYHHLTDDIIEGGLMRCESGEIRVPEAPGLGVKLDRDKLDPGRPGWSPTVPNNRWADPYDSTMP